MKQAAIHYSKLHFPKFFLKTKEARNSFSPFTLPFLKKYLNFQGGYYVELGANNGLGQSNTYHLEKLKNWRGILIEPSPNQFADLKKFRSAKKNKFFCNACVSFDYKEDFVEMNYANLMTISLSLPGELDHQSHAQAALPYMKSGEKIHTFKSKARTLTSIFKEANAPHKMDFLSLDVEGVEMEVLQGIDHDLYRFRYLLVEIFSQKQKMVDYLKKQDYFWVEEVTDHDFLFQDGRKE